MRMVKSLLLGSAAGIVAVAGAQAADLPVKAKPVEYVKVCTLYGAGFWYVPGTNTCIKVGSYIRYQQEYQASGGLIYRNGANAQYTREEGPGFTHRIRGVVSVDTRTQTDYGTLRGYVRFGAHETTPPAGVATFFDRAFIQFGGLTAGLADSFFDFFSLARYNFANNFFSSNMGATGQLVLGYTFQFGGGWSASLAIENGGDAAAGAAATGGRGKVTLDLDQGALNGALGATPLDNGSYQMPDIVANIRVDQAWGSAQIMGALHQNRGAYYNSLINGACPNVANLGTDACTYPTDEIGWAVGAGLILNNLWAPGSSVSVQANYGKGAIGYVLRGTAGYRIYGHGQNLGVGTAADSVFGCSGNLGGVGAVGGAPGCIGLELTEAWGITAGAEHRWNPQWRTSVYGGYVDVHYGGGAQSLICSGGGAFPFATNLVPAPGTAFNCNPDFSIWALGTRTMWNPHPYLDIGVDVLYVHLDTAFNGSTVVHPATTSRQAGIYTIEDQDILTVMGRIQYNFLP